MKVGIVGYQGSGKSTLFQWLTDVDPDAGLAHVGQTAMAAISDSRFDPLCAMYQPKKVTRASLELVDTPGLSRTHEGNAARLSVLREVGCLVLVVAGFAGSDPMQESASFAEDLILADMEIVSGRIERLRDSVKRPRPNREQEQAELEALEPILARLEAGLSLVDFEMNEVQTKAVRAFGLLAGKPKLILVNLADDDDDAERFAKQSAGGQVIVGARVGLELELARMSEEDRVEFERELGLEAGSRRDALLHTILETTGQLLYFTAGEKEVRSWLLPREGTALDAAANIHSDLARGFIRAETIACADLVQAGSEREAKAANLMRQEPKDYVVKDGDVLLIRFSV